MCLIYTVYIFDVVAAEKITKTLKLKIFTAFTRYHHRQN